MTAPAALAETTAEIATGPIVRPAPRRTGRFLVAGLVALVVLAGSALVAMWLAAGHRGGGPDQTAAESVRAAPVAESATAAPATSVAATSAQPTTSAPPSSARPADPNLVAMDDFTGTRPDPAHWALYESTDANGAAWSPSMDQVVGGELRIVGTGRNPTGSGNVSGGLCWCAPGANRTYGKWQVRARFDAGAGYGPVIGLWPQSDKAADGSISVSFPAADRHTGYANLRWTSGTLHTDSRQLSGDFTRWHVYTFEWRAGVVRILMDGTPLYDSTTSTVGAAVPQIPMHLYLQQTVGPKDGVPAAGPTTPDQVITHVDWIRIYR